MTIASRINTIYTAITGKIGQGTTWIKNNPKKTTASVLGVGTIATGGFALGGGFSSPETEAAKVASKSPPTTYFSRASSSDRPASEFINNYLGRKIFSTTSTFPTSLPVGTGGIKPTAITTQVKVDGKTVTDCTYWAVTSPAAPDVYNIFKTDSTTGAPTLMLSGGLDDLIVTLSGKGGTRAIDSKVTILDKALFTRELLTALHEQGDITQARYDTLISTLE
jgi:hypothetical protein